MRLDNRSKGAFMPGAPRIPHISTPFGRRRLHGLDATRIPKTVLLTGALSSAIALGALCGCTEAIHGRTNAANAPKGPQIAEVMDTTAEEADALDPDNIARRRTAEQARAELDAAISAAESRGAEISCIAVERDGGNVVFEHEADRAYYSASTVKGPFCIGLVRSQGDAARSRYGNLITPTIVDSSNEAYEELRKRLAGQPILQDLFREAGVERDSGHWYTDYSVRDLAAIWRTCAPWLSSDDPNARWLGDLLGDSLNSSVDDVAPIGRTATWSKAGWFSGERRYDVTFDGGVVNMPQGSYAIAVATDRGSDFETVKSVMRPLAELAAAELPPA